jgi:pimeloyl-ACP methyl ester carboxylesterase
MGSNFYRSGLKKAFLDMALAGGPAVLSFNNRGAERGTEDESFAGCLADLDAALRFGRAEGYRRFILAGHSTGCQKIVHYQARRQRTEVAGLVLLAPADDYAICRRDLGRRFGATVARARARVAAGRGREPVTGLHEVFSARRFLSIADRRRPEAAVFDYEGPMRAFRAIEIPVLALFGAREEFAVLPVAGMLDRLAALHPPGRVTTRAIPGADHGFHGRERRVAAVVRDWILMSDER